LLTTLLNQLVRYQEVVEPHDEGGHEQNK